MDFETFKIGVMAATGLDKDALHMYVGIGVYILCLFVLRRIVKKQFIRSFVAVMVVSGVALVGEYLDNRDMITEQGFLALDRVAITASIHDLINTCLLSYVLFALMNATTLFYPSSRSTQMLKRRL